MGLHVFWFGVSAHKAVLFYPLLIIFLWLWLARTNALSLIPLAFVSVLGISLLIFYVFDHGLIPSMFVRRAFFVPANNLFDYYHFFDKHQFVFWSNSITAKFIHYPYELMPADLIGSERGTDSHVNNSFLSTGYMHAGVFGVFVYAVIVGLLFRLMDSISNNNVPNWVAVSVLIVPSRSLLLSADLPTALLTHGIGVSIIIIFLLNAKRSYSKRCGYRVEKCCSSNFGA